MLGEVTAEILELSRDTKFIRNLSCTSIIAIACLCGLSDLQTQDNKASEQAIITNMSHSTAKLRVNYR